MTDTRLIRLPRSAPLVGAILMAAAVVSGGVGCGGGNDDNGGGNPSDDTGTSAPDTGANPEDSSAPDTGANPEDSSGGDTSGGDTSASDTSGPPSGMPGSLAAIATGLTPFDAALSGDGKTVYITGTDKSSGNTGVFSVDITDPAHPGAPKVVSADAAFVAPFGIAVSADDKTLFVADPAAGTVDGVGVVFQVSASGGAPSAVSGTAGLSPRGLEIAGDQLYITGRGADGKAGLFKIAAAGGSLTTLASGEPFDEPDSVAVTHDGTTQYVLDASAGTGHTAAIIKISGGTASVFVDHVKVGFPPGISLTPDEATLLVSALDSSNLNDAVYAVNVADKSMTPSAINSAISGFNASAGLHCSRTQIKCVWADSLANGGTVYLLSK